MALNGLLRFENPEVFPIAAGLLLFVLFFALIKKFSKIDKGPAIIISSILGITAGVSLYRNPEIWEANVAYIILTLVVLTTVFLILRAFFRFFRKQFR